MNHELLERYRRVRGVTDRLCEPLSAEDCLVQSMPDVSPTRWHLAHTTWFFEQFVLAAAGQYRPFDPRYGYLFNSYYNAVGEQFPRARRGLISRPGWDEIRRYRRHVDEQISHLIEQGGAAAKSRTADVLALGLQHEQQHQELILTDIKHVLSCNPLDPVYQASAWSEADGAVAEWLPFDAGVYEVGHCGDGFAYDNEQPRHRVFVESFALATQPVTCGEYRQFIEDGGYRRPELWLSLGWQTVCERRWQTPEYWRQVDGQWCEFTLAGLVELVPRRPVCHVSYFEADAFARWAGARLPTEAEWEVAAVNRPVAGNFADTLLARGMALHPSASRYGGCESPARLFGDVWEWTSSAYAPYPGYAPPMGALGEYNGKFMCNQYVLRGGSCASSQDHLRATYRNFFPPDARWQFSGIRLARS